MKRTTTTLLSCSLLLFAVTLAPAVDTNAEGSQFNDNPIQHRYGDPSPSIDESNINNYINQDEQVNIAPGDEDVLVLRTDQKNLLNRFVTETYHLKHVNPREIVNVMREVAGKEGGHAEVIYDKMKRQNFLQVVVPAWQLPFIEQAVKVLDKPYLREYDDGTDWTMYFAKNRDIDEIDEIAQFYAGGDDATGYSTLDLGMGSSMRIDEPYRVENYLQGAAAADVPEHKALFTTKIYEVATGNDLRLGLDYIAWKNGPGRNLFNFGFWGYDYHDRFREASSYLTPWNPRMGDNDPTDDQIVAWEESNKGRFYNLNFFVTAAYIDFLASKNKAKTLAEGSTVVKSGQWGHFSAVDDIVHFEATPLDPGPYGHVPTVNDLTANQLEPQRDGSEKPWFPSGIGYLEGDAGHTANIHNRQLDRAVSGEVGLFLDFFPVILKESIEATVYAEVTSVKGYTPQGLPWLNSASVDTQIRMKDGVPTVISGLSRDESIETKSGAPWLSDLPVLGWAFGGENNSDRTTEIVIVVTPEVQMGGDGAYASAPKVNTIKTMVTGDEAPELPKNSFGFDQWLLGSSSGSDL